MAYIADQFTPNISNSGIGSTPRRTQTLAANGAITIADGVVFVTKAGVAVMTIDDPPLNMDGAILHIVSETANAHTLTNTTGFGGGTTTRDVGTWGGAISDSMTLVADGGVWWVLATRNVTLG